MFSNILLSVLLLTCVSTHVLKSIKHNNNTNAQKLPDNFNFESNGIQTVKPNVKTVSMHMFSLYIKAVLGDELYAKLESMNFNLEN